MGAYLLTMQEAAERLGIKAATVRSWVLSRQIGYIKVGKKLIRIPASEVEKIIERGRVPARQ
jgi:excisionase family DNA binding protein